MKIILASKSPRRQELLKKIVNDFEVIASLEEEVKDDKLTPLENCIEIAYQKALNVMNKTEGDRIIISSDTIVLKDKEILGKPKNREDAYYMLNKLKGTSNEVITSLIVLKIVGNQKEEYKTYSKGIVYVDDMTNEEINAYLDCEEPYDKAGAYAVQGVFSKHVTKVEGDYMAIIGLPVNKLYNILKKLDITLK